MVSVFGSYNRENLDSCHGHAGPCMQQYERLTQAQVNMMTLTSKAQFCR